MRVDLPPSHPLPSSCPRLRLPPALPRPCSRVQKAGEGGGGGGGHGRGRRRRPAQPPFLHGKARGTGRCAGAREERGAGKRMDGRGWGGQLSLLKKKKKTFPPPPPSTRAHRPAMAADGPIPPATKAGIDAAFSGPAESMTEHTLRPRPPAAAYALACVPGLAGPQVCCFFFHRRSPLFVHPRPRGCSPLPWRHSGWGGGPK